jgi:hypothetical protein
MKILGPLNHVFHKTAFFCVLIQVLNLIFVRLVILPNLICALGLFTF